MPERPTRAVYDEPTVMWRMQRDNGLQARAEIGARDGGGTVVVWFINNHPFGFREFSGWALRSAGAISSRPRTGLPAGVS